MHEHLGDERNLPIVIFPEGTCINNTSVMQFKKGAFEIENATVYPVAIRVSTANEKYVLYEYLAMHCALYSYVCLCASTEFTQYGMRAYGVLAVRPDVRGRVLEQQRGRNALAHDRPHDQLGSRRRRLLLAATQAQGVYCAASSSSRSLHIPSNIFLTSQYLNKRTCTSL